MSQITCPYCSTLSPENAFYCQECGRPLKCQKCGANFLPTAHVCIQCGNIIPEISSGNQFHSDTITVPQGYNRLRLHETPVVRDVDLLLSDNSVKQIRDIIPPFINSNLATHRKVAKQETNEQPKIIEVPANVSSTQPQLPAALSRPDTPSLNNQGIWEIFSEHEGRIRQEIPDLKATSRKDYTIRLTYLYLYAKLQNNEKTVSRIEVYKFLEDAGVKDTNTANYISKDKGIRTEDSDLTLNQAGRNKAQQYILEVLNTELSEGWYPGTEIKSVNNQTKKVSNKKGTERQSSSKKDVADWALNSATVALKDTIPHSTLSTMTLQNISLFGLYGLSKAGISKEVPPSVLCKYLYDAFQIQAKADSIRHPLQAAAGKKPPYATYKDAGYRITTSGIQYIEEMLKQYLGQQTAAITNEGTPHEDNA